MPRPLEFDRPATVDKALVLFWRKGYQASSLADLLDAMGISRSSFYATFEDKRRLYIECLELFAERTKDVLLRARKDTAPLDALRSFFVSTATVQRSRRTDWGCMMVNTVLEMSGVDDDLGARASACLAAMQTEFERCLVDAGFPPARTADLASFLMLFNEGLRVSSRRKVSRERQLSDIDTTFHLIERELAP